MPEHVSKHKHLCKHNSKHMRKYKYTCTQNSEHMSEHMSKQIANLLGIDPSRISFGNLFRRSAPLGRRRTFSIDILIQPPPTPTPTTLSPAVLSGASGTETSGTESPSGTPTALPDLTATECLDMLSTKTDELSVPVLAERVFLPMPRSMPTANAEDPCRSEGSLTTRLTGDPSDALQLRW